MNDENVNGMNEAFATIQKGPAHTLKVPSHGPLQKELSPQQHPESQLLHVDEAVRATVQLYYSEDVPDPHPKR